VEKFVGAPEFLKLLRLAEKSVDDPSREAARLRLHGILHWAWEGAVVDKPFYEAADAACESFLHAAECPRPIVWNYRLNADVHYATWSAQCARNAVNAENPGTVAHLVEAAAQSDLVRDIFGNPFRPVAFDPRWRTSDVVGLAQAIYDDKAFERMPILADALMDAGCEDEQIIGHCRGKGPHVRGCWVVDLVLGKE
jgi:hypothetical protein